MDNNDYSDELYFSGMTEKQKKIYESALEIFAEKGFSGTSTGEIAKKAGVAEGLIFKHFKNKKLLFQKIAFMAVEKTILPLTILRTKKILSENYTDLRFFLNLFFNERLDFIKKHRTFLRIIIQEMSFDAELQNFAKKQFTEKMFPMVSEFIKRHQKKGVIIDLDPSIIIRMVMSSFLGYSILRFILSSDEEWDDDMQIKSMIDILCNGLIKRK
ncbi:MAG: TetR/AcrR family transcriptional regulator [Spirochaetia bacterium]|nr:TetR/AcrR family transcriptional regulator [Spirochaetia bacterium]